MKTFHLEHFAVSSTSNTKESIDCNALTQPVSSDVNQIMSLDLTNEDFFDKAKGPCPPTVPTSEEFRKWYEKLEKEKRIEEQLRQEKKEAREKKKQLSKDPIIKSKQKQKARDKKQN